MRSLSRSRFKRPLLVAVLGFGLVPSARSLVDTNVNGLSDLWEQQFNNWVLFDSSFDPEADADGDGWINTQEAAAGTNPFDGVPPSGILCPAILQIPAVFGDPDENGNPVVITPDALQVSWPTLKGKRYTLQFSTDLTLGGWNEVEAPVLGNGGTLTYTFVRQSTALFWRVIVADHDSDGDEFTDWEEDQKGTDPQVADRDDDGLPDSWEIENSLNPNDNSGGDGWDGDFDNDSVSNGDELEGDGEPDDPADFPVRVIQITKGASGYSNYTAYDPPREPYSGWKEWGQWWTDAGNQVAVISDEAATPAYFDSIVEGMAFPATPPTSLPQVWQSNLSRPGLLHSHCHVNRPPEGNSINSGLTSTRVWIKAPAAPVARSFSFVKVRDYTAYVHGPANIHNYNFVSAQLVTAIIPSNETISNPIDLKYIGPIIDGCDVMAFESLEPVDLDIEYGSQGGIKELEETKEDTGDGGYVSLKSQTYQGENITPTTFLVIRPIPGLPAGRKVRLKFDAGDRYKIATDRLGTNLITSELTEFPAGQETRLHLIGERKSLTRGGEQITLQIENNGSWHDADAVKATVVQTQFQIDLRVFIPYNWVNIPHPAHIFRVAGGDSRDYDPQLAGTYRVAQWAIVNLYPEWIPEPGNRVIENGKSAGTTKHYRDSDVFNWDDGAKHSEDTIAKPSYVKPGAPVVDSGVADLSNVDSYVVASLTDSAKCYVKFEGTASEPIIAFAAPIDWRINVGISKQDPLNPQFVMQGVHDGFPAYEIYINCKHSIFPYTSVLQWKPHPSVGVMELVGYPDVTVGPATGLIKQ